MILYAFDPIGALVFGVVAGAIAGVVLISWAAFCVLKNKREAKCKRDKGGEG